MSMVYPPPGPGAGILLLLPLAAVSQERINGLVPTVGRIRRVGVAINQVTGALERSQTAIVLHRVVVVWSPTEH